MVNPIDSKLEYTSIELKETQANAKMGQQDVKEAQAVQVDVQAVQAGAQAVQANAVVIVNVPVNRMANICTSSRVHCLVLTLMAAGLFVGAGIMQDRWGSMSSDSRFASLMGLQGIGVGFTSTVEQIAYPVLPSISLNKRNAYRLVGLLVAISGAIMAKAYSSDLSDSSQTAYTALPFLGGGLLVASYPFLKTHVIR